MAKFTLKDIPDSRVGQVTSDFEREGCQVKKTKQPNSKWTVVADCPDKKKGKKVFKQMAMPGDDDIFGDEED